MESLIIPCTICDARRLNGLPGVDSLKKGPLDLTVACRTCHNVNRNIHRGLVELYRREADDDEVSGDRRSSSTLASKRCAKPRDTIALPKQ